jgi:RNA polymerase sigma-70 factor (ECF subfamily)
LFPSGSGKERPAIEEDTDIAMFDQLIQRNKVTCIKRALRILRNRSDAEDAVQTAVWKAFQRRDQFQGNGTFAAWLSRIVENECLMQLREARNARFVSLDNPIESDTRLELVGPNTNPEDELGRKEVAKVLRTEMLRMPSLFRDVMLLHDTEQLPMPEVAERLGLSVSAAKSRLARARRELCLRVGKHCGQKGPGTLLERATYRRVAYARAS